MKLAILYIADIVVIKVLLMYRGYIAEAYMKIRTFCGPNFVKCLDTVLIVISHYMKTGKFCGMRHEGGKVKKNMIFF